MEVKSKNEARKSTKSDPLQISQIAANPILSQSLSSPNARPNPDLHFGRQELIADFQEAQFNSNFSVSQDKSAGDKKSFDKLFRSDSALSFLRNS